MGLRFQHRVTLFPGVRINFSGGGISTTLGVPGACVNVGPRGNYLNLGIPGSGLSYRTPLGAHHQQPRLSHPRRGYQSVPEDRPLLPGEGEIRSRDVSELTSPGLAKLKELINAAAQQRAAAAVKLKESQSALERAEFKLGVAKAFIVRLLFGRAVPGLHKAVNEKREESDACKAVHDAAVVNINFAFDGETWRTWTGVVEAFGKVCESARIWDVTASYYTNMAAERTNAARAIVRVPVMFDTINTDVVCTKWPALRLQNSSGQHVHIYPGFAMMRDNTGDFALVDLLELSIGCTDKMFHEEEGVPPDAEVCGQTWKKANKDGGPDRRFSNNFRIPIALYGQIDMSSPTGINERYMISNKRAVAVFGSCYDAHVRALRTMSRRSEPADLALPAPYEADPAASAVDDNVQPVARQETMAPPPLRHLFFDMAVVIAIVAGCWYYALTYERGITTPPPAVSVPAVMAQKAPAQPTPSPALRTVVIKIQSANVRSSPSASAAPVGTLPAGKAVSVFETSGNWLRIGDKEPMGWVHKSVTKD